MAFNTNCATEEKFVFNFIEDYFYRLPSQGNIYTLVPLIKKNGNCKFLVATLQKKIFCLEYSTFGSYSLIEVPLASIPNGADIVSIDATLSSINVDMFNVGVSFCKKEGVEVTENFLNIYSNWEIPSSKETETSSCCTLNLNYMPYYLFCTFLPSDLRKDSPIWILCGSDCVVHLYTACDKNSFEEVSSSKNGFPEFTEANDITVRLDISYPDESKSRITAMCGDRGNVSIFFVDLFDANAPKIKSKRFIRFDFPASCSKFFKRYNYGSYTLPALEGIGLTKKDDKKLDDSHYIVIATSLEACFVHRDIEKDHVGFQLPQSDNYDVVTSCLVCDIDFDGVNEVLLGTYGQTVLIYHANPKEENKWVLVKILPFSSPVLSLAYEDFLGDGAGELIVHTMSGVHIYQYDLKETSSLLLERLRNMLILKNACTDDAVL